MTEDKTIKKKTYKWAHIGVIIYHIITAILLLISQFLFNDRVKKYTVVVLSVLLLIVSLLALVPILKDYKKIIIE